MAAFNMESLVGPIASSASPFIRARHAPGKWKSTMIRNIEYKMRGFNALTNQFEYWSTHNPLAGPPSGNTLTNKAISAIIVDKFPDGE